MGVKMYEWMMKQLKVEKLFLKKSMLLNSVMILLLSFTFFIVYLFTHSTRWSNFSFHSTITLKIEWNMISRKYCFACIEINVKHFLNNTYTVLSE